MVHYAIGIFMARNHVYCWLWRVAKLGAHRQGSSKRYELDVPDLTQTG